MISNVFSILPCLGGVSATNPFVENTFCQYFTCTSANSSSSFVIDPSVRSARSMIDGFERGQVCLNNVLFVCSIFSKWCSDALALFYCSFFLDGLIHFCPSSTALAIFSVVKFWTATMRHFRYDVKGFVPLLFRSCNVALWNYLRVLVMRGINLSGCESFLSSERLLNFSSLFCIRVAAVWAINLCSCQCPFLMCFFEGLMTAVWQQWTLPASWDLIYVFDLDSHLLLTNRK